MKTPFARTRIAATQSPGGNMPWAVALLLALWLVAGTAAAVGAQTQKPAFVPGEKLTFALRWAFVPVGWATLEVLPMASIDGRQAYHFRMSARTNAFADAFYKVRDQVEAWADLELTHSLRYTKQQREGHYRRDEQVEFNWDRNQADYHEGLKDETKVTPLIPGAFDPLSAFYYARHQSLTDNSQLERPITDGRKCVIGRARVVKRQKVYITDQTYDTFLLEPELRHIKGVFEKSKNARIKVWLTADHRSLPVKLASKVVVGSFVAELVSAENTAP